MRDFRNELLKDLLVKSGEFIDIKYLTDKYCGSQTKFDPHDTDISQCRLSINRVLRELKEMKWIDLTPSGGMSTAEANILYNKLRKQPPEYYISENELVNIYSTDVSVPKIRTV